MTCDSLTEEGAHQLALNVENYWLNKGYKGIKTKVVNEGFDHSSSSMVFGVRSNIGPNGMPPRK